MPVGASRIEIPRGIQLVGLPLPLVLAWVIAGPVPQVAAYSTAERGRNQTHAEPGIGPAAK